MVLRRLLMALLTVRWRHEALGATVVCACFPVGAMTPLWRNPRLRLLPSWRHEALGATLICACFPAGAMTPWA